MNVKINTSKIIVLADLDPYYKKTLRWFSDESSNI